MATTTGPNLYRENLLCHLDFANKKSYKNIQNIITPNGARWNSWQNGASGTHGGYNENGGGKNEVIYSSNYSGSGTAGTAAYGDTDFVWQTIPDTASTADGGWNTSSVEVDSTKLYRFTCFIRRPYTTSSSTGNSYIGLEGYTLGAASEIGVVRKSGGSASNNPYWFSSDFHQGSGAYSSSFNNSEWYLLVGHVFPAGSAQDSISHPDSGLWRYPMNGENYSKVTSITDWIWVDNRVRRTRHRCYLYYEVEANSDKQFFQPRIDLVDGSEPSLYELMNGVGSKILDLSGNGNDGTIYNNPMYVESSNSNIHANYLHLNSDITNNSTVVDNETQFVQVTVPDSGPTRTIVCAYQYTANANRGPWAAVDNSMRLFQGTLSVRSIPNTYYALTGGLTGQGENAQVTVVVVDGTSVKVYQNGILTDSTTMDDEIIGQGTSEMYRMGRTYSGTDTWHSNIKIYNWMYYSSALNADQVYQLSRNIQKRLGI